MTVYEIRKPTPVPTEHPKPIHKETEPVERVMAATPVDRLLKRWRRPKERQGERRRNAPLLPDGAKEVRTMIGKANQNLEQQGVPVRLVLIREEEGYAIDVYDCQDDSACRTIGDLLIDLDDLPTLLRNLDREAGILVDIIS